MSKATEKTKIFYAGDDEATHFVRKTKAPRPTRLRKSITPGTILIVLAGRFKGRRVVFIKQLPSGLLLVTGPYKINGVPLRRINQAYVIPTSTSVSLAGVDAAKVDDSFFARPKTAHPKRTDDSKFFQGEAQLSEEDKANIKQKRATQSTFDTALIANVKKVENLSSYLSKRFSLRGGQLPHLLRF